MQYVIKTSTFGSYALIIFLQQTLKFINDEASSVHGALRVGSLYTSESGEWRVGGLEVLSNIKDDDAIIYVSLAYIRPGACN